MLLNHVTSNSFMIAANIVKQHRKTVLSNIYKKGVYNYKRVVY